MAEIVWNEETGRLMQGMPAGGIFMTGIEGSDPIVGGRRRDQMLEAGDFYTTYEERLTRIKGLGINWLRLGPPYSKVHLAEDQYDFTWFDKIVATCEGLGIEIILDLLHFGLPDWMHEGGEAGTDLRYFQNPRFPAHFARYVREIVRRYPKIRWFTPVNEPFVTAHFSSQSGIWNEGHTTAEAFANAVVNISEAAIFARQQIETIWAEAGRPGEPLYVQNESFELALADEGMELQAETFNRIYRFCPLDLILGHRDEQIRHYLLAHGIAEERYEWFMRHGSPHGTLLGIDFYPWCVHMFHADYVEDFDATKPYELDRVVRDYWSRYPLPLLHTEVNAWPEHALEICQWTYDQLRDLKREGYPIAGMAWYGDESQMDWHTALIGDNEETPVGLFRAGQPQDVAFLFSAMASRGL